MLKKTLKRNLRKWHIAVRVLPVIVVVVILKIVADYYRWEVMQLNTLFTSLVAGMIFLISFLVKGVLADYKEAERIPGELAATIKSLYDDADTIYGSKQLPAAKEYQQFLRTFLVSLDAWFCKRERTQVMLDKVSAMNRYFIEFDLGGVTANYVIKMKNDQSNLRRTLLRIDTIRDTGFVGSAYAIVETMAFALALGLVIIKIEPLYAAIFFMVLVTFLIAYMLELIKDLDNPFDYGTDGTYGETEVSLKPLADLREELGQGVMCDG